MDLIFVGLIVVFAILGFMKGGIKSLISFILILISLCLTYLLLDNVSEFIFDIDFVRNDMVGFISDKIGGLSDYFTVEVSSIEELQSLINLSDLNSLYKMVFKLLLTNFTLQGTTTVANMLALYITRIIIMIISFVLLFVVFMLISKLIEKLIEKFFLKESVGLYNRFIGLFIGGVKGIVICGVAFFILTAVASVHSFNFITNLMENSEITTYLYKNLAKDILARFMKIS